MQYLFSMYSKPHGFRGPKMIHQFVGIGHELVLEINFFLDFRLVSK